MSSRTKHVPPTDPGPLLDRDGRIDATYVPNFAHCVLPYCTWYQSDFLGGVRGLKGIEIGVYAVLLNEMYERGEALNQSPDRLARWCGTSKSPFLKALAALVDEGKIIRLECGLWNVKVQKVFILREKNSQDNSQAGKKSARKRNEINTELQPPFNGRSTGVQPSSEVQRVDNNNLEDKSSSLLFDNDDYQRFAEAHPRFRETPDGEDAWQSAIEAGNDPSDLVASARRYAEQSKTYDPDKVKFSDNWLAAEGWKKYPAKREVPPPTHEAKQKHWASMVKQGVGFGLERQMAEELVAAGMVTPQQLSQARGYEG